MNGDPVNGFDLDGRCGLGNPFKACGPGHQGGTNLISGATDRAGDAATAVADATTAVAEAGANYIQDHAIDIATGAAAAAVTGGCLIVTSGVGAVACIAAGSGIVYMGSASGHALVDDNKSAEHILTAPPRPIGTGIVCGTVFGSGCLGAALRRGPKPGFPRWPW